MEPLLVPEGRGIFDVVIEGDIVYSKFETGTFPDEKQLVKQLVADFGGES